MEGCYYVSTLNPSKNSITIQAGKEISGVDPVESTKWTVLNEEAVSSISEESPSTPEFLQGTLDAVQVEYRYQIGSLLTRYRHLFHEHAPKSLKSTTVAEHLINTDNHPPIRTAPYRVSPTEREIIRTQINEMLQAGIIEPTTSPWSSPVVMVPKKKK
jgi:hypothetical protein